ncbi:L-serine ammonia-lyase [Chitinasiproducens palmae]|uniref:L-serine dehydratase n=1 Tax=Chitinasiproducens palmae TaxID=1770053 RepID=A0A1H2PQA6_9BURK|nr:L-serine ammonia-lyase [Chitinasiproducens palmae]SDV48541.1 L-serine ammonia-lyase [Chitinasiproducens palmae]
MAVSVLDLFKIGIGPSSSHTVGPMRAAGLFVRGLHRDGLLPAVRRIHAGLYGSLGATGKGHGSDRGVLLGLLGETPEGVDADAIDATLATVAQARTLPLLGVHRISFDPRQDVAFYRKALVEHPNGLLLRAFGEDGECLRETRYLSVGGGFVITAGASNEQVALAGLRLPHPFESGEALLARCDATGLSIAALMRENERAWRDDAATRDALAHIWAVMQACVVRGCRPDAPATLPGPLQIRRRAPELAAALAARPLGHNNDPLAAIDWINLYAMAVNEENASGGRVVTAPTNGAAGVIPAVLHYYKRFISDANEAGVEDFLLTAAAIGTLYKLNASISGAEVGCQGEVGVACSMAAAGLAAVLGATPQQVANAAEIGMEHNLGLTCDPVGGRVQIPCIERNAMGAVKAVNAARLALNGNGNHYVSLDSVIKTMRETGADMRTKYKETSRGGLAVNIIEC